MSDAMLAAASLYNDPRYFSPSEIRIRNNKIRRQRIVRRQLFALSVFTSIILFLLIFMTSSFLSDAQSDSFVPEYKYYKSVTVHSGDTLGYIAKENYSSDHYTNIDSYIDEIISIKMILQLESSLLFPIFLQNSNKL